MKVLSLFDGMSCGQIALDQLGIPVEKYYASEIDKYAIKVTQANYPNTIQVGDVCNLNAEDYKDVSLIQAGSPCQGFSFAGKQLAFDDPRSALFFEFIRLLKAIKPKYFLLENVRMKKEFLEIITEQVSQCYAPEDVDNQFLNVLGEVRFEPIFINSSLLSAQSRQRYYWTNIPGIKQPMDRGIVLRDILETEPDNFTAMSDKFVKRNGNRNCMIDQNKEKASNLSAMEYVKNGRQGNYLACNQSGKPIDKPIKEYISAESVEKYVEDVNADFNDPYNKKTVKGNKSTTLRTNSSNGNMWVNEKAIKETKPQQVGKIKDGGQGNRIYSQDGKSSTLSAQSGGKSPTINTCQGGNREPKVITGGAFRGRAYDEDGKRKDRDGSSVAKQTKQMLELRKDDKSNAITTVGKDSIAVNEDLTWRKLTPLECERLQTVPDNYTNHVSNTQRFKMLGNGWTVEVIKHIYKNMA